MTGKLRQKVTPYSLTSNSDGQGGNYESWSAGTAVFANVERQSGSKQLLYNQIYEGEIYEVVMRYDTGSSFDTDTTKFLYDGKDLIIHETFRVKPEGSRRQQQDRYIGFICSVKNE